MMMSDPNQMIEVPRALLERVVELINMGFNADDCDVFGVAHNDAMDTVSELETILEWESK